jgi:hypothetical protein
MPLTPEKARKILKEGSVRGNRLTALQRGFMGARAGTSALRAKRAKTKPVLRRVARQGTFG